MTLRLFSSVLEERQIGLASTRENIAASAGTKRIRDLEEIVGIKLLERTAKGVVPSPAGVVVAQSFRNILEEIDLLRSSLNQFTEGVRGVLSIASSSGIIMQFLAREFADFKRIYPLVDIALRQDNNPNVIRAVLSGAADIAVIVLGPDTNTEALDIVEYRTDRMVAVVPSGHRLSQRPSVTLLDLLDEDFIGLPPETTMMATIRAAARDADRNLSPAYTVQYVECADSLVQAGLGVCIQPECSVSFEHFDKISTVALDEPWAVRRMMIATLKGRVLGAAASAFLKQLIERPVEQNALEHGAH